MREILRQNAWWALNKTLCKSIGLEASLLLTHLGDVESMLIREDPDVDNVFSYSDKKIENELFLSPYKIGEARKILIKNGLIKVEKKGVPARNFYKIFWSKCEDIFATSDKGILSQATKIFGHYIYKNIYKKVNKKQTQLLIDVEKEFKQKKVALKKWIIDLLIEFMEYRWRDRRKSMGKTSVNKFIKMSMLHGKDKMTKQVKFAMENDWIGIRYENLSKSEIKKEELNRSKLMGDKWNQKNKELEKIGSNGG